MNRKTYQVYESCMLASMNDTAHDKEHIYRVLYVALDIARHEENVDRDILVIACLLHDIGRQAQFENPACSHAIAGAQMAYDFCLSQGMAPKDAQHIKDCIQSHSFRANNPAKTIEAKILFDADKLDATGTLGIARTLSYQDQVKEPLYYTDEQGNVLDGTTDDRDSFLHECNYKLKRIYDAFYTKRGKALAMERQQAAFSFYDSMIKELHSTYQNGLEYLAQALD